MTGLPSPSSSEPPARSEVFGGLNVTALVGISPYAVHSLRRVLLTLQSSVLRADLIMLARIHSGRHSNGKGRPNVQIREHDPTR